MSASDSHNRVFDESIALSACFDSFEQLGEEDVKNLITKSNGKTTSLDPMPTSIVVQCQDVLLPVLTRMINMSLDSGVFPVEWKVADVSSLLKKSNLDTCTAFENLRPVSNLSYVSKLTERTVFNQANDFLITQRLYPKGQSAYRKCHSTETALLRVTNDIMMNMNRQHVTLLVMLDLSSAVDTVDHDILLRRLNHEFGIKGRVLEWFTSYLSKRSQFISVNGGRSRLLMCHVESLRDHVWVPHYLYYLLVNCLALWKNTYLMLMHLLMIHSSMYRLSQIRPMINLLQLYQ